jgi:hypothetical protein
MAGRYSVILEFDVTRVELVDVYRFLATRFLAPAAVGGGTLAPFSLASLNPIAIACFRLVTFRPEPLVSVPFFRRRMVDFTLLDAALPYFAIGPSSMLQDLPTSVPKRNQSRISSRYSAAAHQVGLQVPGILEGRALGRVVEHAPTLPGAHSHRRRNFGELRGGV